MQNKKYWYLRHGLRAASVILPSLKAVNYWMKDRKKYETTCFIFCYSMELFKRKGYTERMINTCRGNNIMTLLKSFFMDSQREKRTDAALPLCFLEIQSFLCVFLPSAAWQQKDENNVYFLMHSMSPLAFIAFSVDWKSSALCSSIKYYAVRKDVKWRTMACNGWTLLGIGTSHRDNGNDNKYSK